MGNRIAALAAAGWAGIIWLAWGMADERIELCGNPTFNKSCVIRATADRDFILTAGLAVALVALLLGLALLSTCRARRLGSVSDWRPASRVEAPRLR